MAAPDDDRMPNPSEDVAAIPAGATVAGTETVDGVTCLVIQYTDPSGTFKEWLRVDCGMPARTEATASDGARVITVYTNYRFDAIPDSMFTLPEGAQVVDFNSIFGGLAPTPGTGTN
jgi:hypothetical protein